MSATVWTKLLGAIHASPHRAVVAVTGGGSKAISQLLEVPGASQTVLEAVVPYSSAALASWLGGVPDQSCSEPTARAMAMAAWIRARELMRDGELMRARELSTPASPPPLVGLAATASLASASPKRGEHRIHVAAQTEGSTVSATLVLTKDQRDRKKEEWLAAKLILVMLGQACAIPTTAAEHALREQLTVDEPIQHNRQEAEPAWSELLLGQRKVASLPSTNAPPPQVIFSGSFNPPHLGHQRIAQVAAELTGQLVAYELSITNVDKLPLDYVEMQRRFGLLQALDRQSVLLLTDAPTFCAKSELFPGCTFVVGVDTMLRIADPRYYQAPAREDSPASYEAAVELLAGRACRFLVFGRLMNNRFQVLSDLAIPAKLRELCDEVPAEQFREDISSSAVRQRS